jgi:hypothetical protein
MILLAYVVSYRYSVPSYRILYALELDVKHRAAKGTKSTQDNHCTMLSD